MLFTEKCLSCANTNQMCCTICGVGRNGEREKYKQKPRTKADRIRAMTDEELANKISGLESFALTCGGGWPPEKWLDWLKQEEE